MIMIMIMNNANAKKILLDGIFIGGQHAFSFIIDFSTLIYF